MAADDPVVVTVAPTGPLTTREQHPRLPVHAAGRAMATPAWLGERLGVG